MVGTIADRRAVAVAASAAVHLAGLALLLSWPAARHTDHRGAAVTTIAFPAPSPAPTPMPPIAERAARPTPSGAQSRSVEAAAVLPIALPSLAAAAEPADGAGAQRGDGTGEAGRGAGGSGTGAGGVRSESAQNTPATWIGGSIRRRSDYPRKAREAGEQGLVETEIAVDSRGRASGCRVVKSSGSAELDQTTCRLIVRRFRFAPARDALGRPVAGTVGYDQRWTYQAADGE